MLTVTGAFALFLILALASATYYVSKRFELPYTVMLALVGVALVPVSAVNPFHFLREFQLTPELLFFIFLPTLIFESAYNINVRRVVDGIKPIMLLAVFSYLGSAFLIGGGLWLALGALQFPIPFSVTLLFGALISATDPVAVLALFKEYGAPRRLSLIFEGESLMNDATALALFLIVLGLIETGVSGGALALGGVAFVVMLLGGILMGLAIGGVFMQLIGAFKNNEIVAITLMIVLAHSTFLIAELSNITLENTVFSFIQFSPIIATTVASLMMGNYGRFKLSPDTEEFIEKFWSQFAFMANSIVFILVGFLFASIPDGAGAVFIPTVVAVLTVAVARALSVYGVLIPYNLVAPVSERVRSSWQHLLSWGSLRGALAVMLVLLIPQDLSVPGWSLDLSVREFLLVLTVASIFTTLFLKAPTIGPLMRWLNIGTLTDLEKAASHEARALIHGTVLIKLATFSGKRYIPPAIARRLTAEHAERFDESLRTFQDASAGKNRDLAERILRLYVIGLEREELKELLVFDEITERIFKRINGKLVIQSEEIERGNFNPDISLVRDYRDVFENIAEFMRVLFVRGGEGAQMREDYLYYRAQKILARKVIKELDRVTKEFESPVFTKESLHNTKALYALYEENALKRMEEIGAANTVLIGAADEELALQSVYRIEERYLERLHRRGMLSPKLFITLRDDYEREVIRQKRAGS